MKFWIKRYGHWKLSGAK
jgi:hypothetical protein